MVETNFIITVPADELEHNGATPSTSNSKPGCGPHLFCKTGWGLLSQFPPFHYFRNFQYYQNTRYLLKNTFIFDRCRRSLAAVASIKYKCEFKWSNKYFCKIENIAYEEINERSFSNHQPWWRHVLLPTRSRLKSPLCKTIAFVLFNHIMAAARYAIFLSGEYIVLEHTATLHAY